MPNDDVTTLQKVVNCIPQVYFDIIGRVIPGTLIIGSIWIAVHGPGEFWKSLKICLEKSTISSATLATVLVILTSYILAFFIWCVWSCLITIICKLCKVCDGSKSRVKKWVREKIYWDNKGFRFMYERLKDKKISAGNRITKLKAQIHMTETLMIGLPVSGLVGVKIIRDSLGVIKDSPSQLYWVILLLAAICSLIARQYFIDHMNNSLKNNIKILDDEKEWKCWY